MYSGICRRLSRFLAQVVLPDPNSIAATIPLDIFVDNISPYLQVEDILALRRVNKYYFHLTHEPLIWKRFLQELRIPIPPIRPTLDYSVQRTDYEFEQLVSRAISIEDNWRKKKPTVASTMAFSASLEVLDMTLLPGGKYLVASIRDLYRFFIALYHLDHPSGPHILARCPIPTKAYKLQAKYMQYKNKPVIMIAYICRVLFAGGPANIDPAQFANGATIDPPARMLHVLNCIHVDLSTLDLLAGAHRDPRGSETTKHKLCLSDNRYKPFTQIVRLSLRTPTEQLSLYSRAGIAHASVVQEAIPNGQDYIVIVNLERPQEPYVLVCQPYIYPYEPQISVIPLSQLKQRIKAVRHLPEQNQVMIWREISTRQIRPRPNEGYCHCLEILQMPLKGGVNFCTPVIGLVAIPAGAVHVVHITDDISPSDEQSDFPLQASSQPPPPISVYIEMKSPQCIAHWHIWPEKTEWEAGPQYVYTLHGITTVKQTLHDPRPHIGHVLPGVFRSLIYTTEATDHTSTPSLTTLRRYISPEFQSNQYPVDRVQHHSAVERSNYKDMPNNVYTRLDMGEEFATRYRHHGLGAIAWDQTIGRVCLTEGGGSVIEVIDFSHAAKVGERFLDWKMAHPGGFQYVVEEENEFDAARRDRLKRYPELQSTSVNEDEDVDIGRNS